LQHTVVVSKLTTVPARFGHGAPFQKRLAPFRAARSRRRLQTRSRRQLRPVGSTSWVSWRARSRTVVSHDRRSCNSTSRASAGGIH